MKVDSDPDLVSLPYLAKAALAKLKPEEQMMFVAEYKRKYKRKLPAYLWNLFLTPAAMFLYVGRTGMCFVVIAVAIITLGWGALIWALFELVYIPHRIRNYNEKLAVNLLRDHKTLMGA